jgi:hypothetical protein
MGEKIPTFLVSLFLCKGFVFFFSSQEIRQGCLSLLPPLFPPFMDKSLSLRPSFFHFLLDEYTSSEYGNSTSRVRSDLYDVLNGVRSRSDSSEWIKQRATELDRLIRFTGNSLEVFESAMFTVANYRARDGTDPLSSREFVGALNVFYDARDKELAATASNNNRSKISRFALQSPQPPQTRDDVFWNVCRDYAAYTLQLARLQHIQQVILFAGTQGHAIVLVLDLERGHLVVCNSGQGLEYHAQQQQQKSAEGSSVLHQLIVVLPNMTDASYIDIIAHTLMVRLLRNSVVSKYATDIDSLYRTHLLPLNSNGSSKQQTQLVSLFPESFFYQPQMAGSCTFYSMYWMLRWFFQTEEALWSLRREMFALYQSQLNTLLTDVELRNLPYTTTLLHALVTKGETVLEQLTDKSTGAQLAKNRGWMVAHEMLDWKSLLALIKQLNAVYAQSTDLDASSDCTQLAKWVDFPAANLCLEQQPLFGDTTTTTTTTNTSNHKRVQSRHVSVHAQLESLLSVRTGGAVAEFIQVLHTRGWSDYDKSEVEKEEAVFRISLYEQWYWRVYDAPDAWFCVPAMQFRAFTHTLFQVEEEEGKNNVITKPEPTVCAIMRWLLWFRAAEQQPGWFQPAATTLRHSLTTRHTMTRFRKAVLVEFNYSFGKMQQTYFDAVYVDMERFASRLYRFQPWLPFACSTFHKNWMTEFATCAPVSLSARSTPPIAPQGFDQREGFLRNGMFQTLLRKGADEYQLFDDDIKAFYKRAIWATSDVASPKSRRPDMMDPFEVLSLFVLSNDYYSLRSTQDQKTLRKTADSLLMQFTNTDSPRADGLLEWINIVLAHDLESLIQLVGNGISSDFVNHACLPLSRQPVRVPGVFDSDDAEIVKTEEQFGDFSIVLLDAPGDTSRDATRSFFAIQHTLLTKTLPDLVKILQRATVEEHVSLILTSLTLLVHYRVDVTASACSADIQTMVCGWLGIDAKQHVEAHVFAWFAGILTTRTPTRLEASLYAFGLCTGLWTTKQLDYGTFDACRSSALVGDVLALRMHHLLLPPRQDEDHIHSLVTRWCQTRSLSRADVTYEVLLPHSPGHKLPMPFAYANIQTPNDNRNTLLIHLKLESPSLRRIQKTHLFCWSHGTSEYAELVGVSALAQKDVSSSVSPPSPPLIVQVSHRIGNKQTDSTTTANVRVVRDVYDGLLGKMVTMVLCVDTDQPLWINAREKFPSLMQRGEVWMALNHIQGGMEVCIQVNDHVDAPEWRMYRNSERHTTSWRCDNERDGWEVMAHDVPLMARWVQHLPTAVLQRHRTTQERRVRFEGLPHLPKMRSMDANAFGELSKSFQRAFDASFLVTEDMKINSEQKIWTLKLSRNGLYAHTDGDSDALLLFLVLAVQAQRYDLVHALYNQFLSLCVSAWRTELSDIMTKQLRKSDEAFVYPKDAGWQLHACRLLCCEKFGSPFVAYFQSKACIYVLGPTAFSSHEEYVDRASWYPFAYQLDQQKHAAAASKGVLPLVCRFERMQKLLTLPLVSSWSDMCRTRNGVMEPPNLKPRQVQQLDDLQEQFGQERADSLTALSTTWLAQRHSRNFHLFGWLAMPKERRLFYDILECDAVLVLCNKLAHVHRQSTTTAQECSEIRDIVEQIKGDSDVSVSRAPRDPATILFETSFDMLIQHQQHVLARNIYAKLVVVVADSNASTTPWMSTFQLLMGKGKTSVVSPLLVFRSLLETGAREHHVIVLPAHLVHQSCTMFVSRYANVLPWMCVQSPVVQREDTAWAQPQSAKKQLKQDWTMPLPYLHQRLSIISDNTLKALKLNCIEQGLAQQVLDYFPRYGRILFDEVDTLLDPLTNELNYPLVGSSEQLVEHELLNRLVVDLVCYAAVHKQIGPFASVQEAGSSIASLLRVFVQTPGVTDKPYFASLAYYLVTFFKHPAASLVYSTSKVDAHQVYLVHRVIATLMHCTLQIHNKDYGFGTLDETRFVRKNGLVAVPYNAVQVPSDGSEFSDVILSMVLTTLCYCLQTDTRKVDRQVFQGLAKAEYQVHRSIRILLSHPLLGSVISLGGKRGVKVFDDIAWPNVWSTLDSSAVSTFIPRVAYVQALLCLSVFPSYMWLHKKQMNASLLDVVCPSFATNRVGFSGTVSLPRLLHYPGESPGTNVRLALSLAQSRERTAVDSWLVPDAESALMMRKAMLGSVHEARVWEEGKDEGVDSLDALLDLVVREKHDVLIDAGAYLLRYTAEQVAFRLHARFQQQQSHTKHIVFCDTQNVLQLVTSSTTVQPYRNEWAASSDLFIYYDQPHIVGVDVKQPYSMRGLVTVAHFNTYTEVAQAAFRLRNLNRGHRFDYYCFRDSARLWADLQLLQVKRKGKTANVAVVVADANLPINTAANMVRFLELNEQLTLDKKQRQMQVQCCKVLRRYKQTTLDKFVDETFNGRITELATLANREPLEALQQWTKEQLCRVVTSTPYKCEVQALCTLIQEQQNREPLYNMAGQNRMQAQSTQATATRTATMLASKITDYVISELQLQDYFTPDDRTVWPDENTFNRTIYVSPLLQRQGSAIFKNTTLTPTAARQAWMMNAACYMTVVFKETGYASYVILSRQEANALLLTDAPCSKDGYNSWSLYTQDGTCLRDNDTLLPMTMDTSPYAELYTTLTSMVQAMAGKPLKLGDRVRTLLTSIGEAGDFDEFWKAYDQYDALLGAPVLWRAFNGDIPATKPGARIRDSNWYAQTTKYDTFKQFRACNLPTTVDKFVGSKHARMWKRLLLFPEEDKEKETDAAKDQETDALLYETLTCLFDEAKTTAE